MYNILIIEDSFFIRHLLKKHLLELDMKVVAETGDPHEGIALYSQLHPDVTLLDYSLPEMNGIKVAEEILKRNIYARLVILLPTRMMDTSHDLIAMGIKAVIAKPFYPDKFQSTLIEVVVNI